MEPDSEKDFDLCKAANDTKSSQSIDDARSPFFTQLPRFSEKLG